MSTESTTLIAQQPSFCSEKTVAGICSIGFIGACAYGGFRFSKEGQSNNIDWTLIDLTVLISVGAIGLVHSAFSFTRACQHSKHQFLPEMNQSNSSNTDTEMKQVTAKVNSIIDLISSDSEDTESSHSIQVPLEDERSTMQKLVAIEQCLISQRTELETFSKKQQTLKDKYKETKENLKEYKAENKSLQESINYYEDEIAGLKEILEQDGHIDDARNIVAGLMQASSSRSVSASNSQYNTPVKPQTPRQKSTKSRIQLGVTTPKRLNFTPNKNDGK